MLNATDTKQTIYPALRYADAPAAIAWLERVFGFEPNVIAEHEGAIAHAELRCGHDLVMLGSSRDPQLGVSPREIGGRTLGLYVCIADPDERYRRARSEGADVLGELVDTDYGSRNLTVSDLEGHVWTFGTYAVAAESNISASARYADANAAIAWLERAFGFERKMVVPDGEGGVAHSELAFGGSVFMAGSAGGDGDAAIPSRVGGISGSIYVYPPDPDAHSRRAAGAGAEVVREPVDMEYGSREYSVRDPEGHLWSFGTYRP